MLHHEASPWIVGLGAVSAAGADVAGTLSTFHAGVRFPSTVAPFPTSITCPTFQVDAQLPQLPRWRNSSRTLRLAMCAVGEALVSAQLEQIPPDVRVGVCLGTTVASQLNNLPFYDAYRRNENPALGPVHEFLNANLAEAVADVLQVCGPRMTVVNACSSGTDAIGIAASWIGAGLCDIAIAGGADELSLVPLAGFLSLGVMSDRPCQPFDRDRSGLNLGEGAGILILESAGHAESRRLEPAFALAGYGAGCDAYHLTGPHPDGRGLEAAVWMALEQAGIGPSEIGFINAHGTATQDNDRVEGNLIARLFGSTTPFLSTKGYTGHTLGAAGGLEAVFTVLGLREGWIPSSVGFEIAADDIAAAPVRELTYINGSHAISTSLAFGGNNAALVVKRAV